jgi:hypothetical protein
MAWKEVAASLGTEAALSGLFLELHPDIGRRKARRRARRVTGARPSKKLLRAAGKLGWKEGAQGAATALGAAGVAKVVGAVGGKLKEKLGDGSEDVGDTDRAEGRRSTTAVPRRSRRRGV